MKELMLSIVLLFSMSFSVSAGVILSSECKDEYRFITVEQENMKEFLESLNDKKVANLQFITRETETSIKYDVIFTETICKDICYKELTWDNRLDESYYCE